MNTQKTILLIIGALVIGAGAWYLISSGPPTASDPSNSAGAVAIVNGEEISRTQLEVLKSQIALQQGADLSSLDEEAQSQLDRQIVDELVSQALLRQAVSASGVVVSQAEVDAQIDATITQLGGEEAFREALATEGISEEELREQLSADLTRQAYLEQELNLSSVTAIEEEVEAAYAQAVAQASPQEEDIPPLADVQAQVEQSVIQQKQQSLLAQFIDQLRAEADIEILL